jgi:hypothetical protein
MPALAFVLAALVGLCLGLLGSGGSIVTLPVLVYVWVAGSLFYPRWCSLPGWR